MILVYKLGLAQLAQSIEKNVMDLKYLITIGPLQQLMEFMAKIGLAFCSVSHGVYMIKVLAASTTILGMDWGGWSRSRTGSSLRSLDRRWLNEQTGAA